MEQAKQKPKQEQKQEAGRSSGTGVTRTAASSGIKITSVSTRNGSLFDPFGDDIVLDIVYDQTPELIATPGLFLAGIWQIISVQTNQVIKSWRFESARPPLGLPSVLWWLNIGTAHSEGIQWVPGGDIFGFRGIVEAYKDNGPAGIETLASFDVSDIFWFRLKNLSQL